MKQTPGGREKTPTFSSEIWFAVKDADLETLQLRMEEGGTIDTVRLGDRSSGTSDPKGGYAEGRSVRVRIRNDDGTFAEREANAVTVSVRKKKIGELSAEDLEHGLPGERDKESVLSSLENFYGKKLTDDEDVTILQISFSKENSR